ncbi:AAA family ATPase [Amycolatopsis thermalba]|uniref:AAA family ATPase n=1 Tax=Amycolatopsis thermalba TaxID=944492 RepID=A0ABY4P5W4_9PSEU|nr:MULTISPECIES: AAA family ATPase [Amycolatopsis]UQS27568.1 AAA family ATPase [Amycolatopsis thermalba]
MTIQPLSDVLGPEYDTDDESRDERPALAQRRPEEHLIAIARTDDGRDNRSELVVEGEDFEWFDHKDEGPNSWYPQSLWEDFLDIEAGYDLTLMPDMGYREDGQCLIYRGRINWVAGEPEAGKGWFALMVALQTMEDGWPVVYIDFDHTRMAILRRLLDMGADKETLLKYFHYVKPGTSVSDKESRSRFEEVIGRIDPALVIVDTATEAAVNEGLDLIMNPNDVIAFKRRLLQPIIDFGAAVLVIDHTAPGPITRYPMGAKHKRAMTNGAMYMIQREVPISPGGRGKSLVWLARDKEGQIQKKSMQNAGYPDIEGNLELVGILRADGETRQVADLDVYLDMPQPSSGASSTPSGRRHPGARRRGSTGGVNVEGIKACLDRDPAMSKNKIYDQVKGNRKAVLAKVDELRAARTTET